MGVFTKLRLSARKRLHELRGERYFVRNVRGRRYVLDRDSIIDRHVDAFGSWEREQIEFLVGQLRRFRPDLFLDIGAHWGLYSLEVALRDEFRDVEIVAFEPESRSRAQLQANLFVNDLGPERVVLRDCGLSRHDGTVGFSRRGGHNPGASRVDAEGTIRIRVRSLDSELQPRGRRVALKIDVEGHELDVLEGAQALLGHNTCLLQIESALDEPIESIRGRLGGGYRHVRSIGSDHYFTNAERVPGEG